MNLSKPGCTCVSLRVKTTVVLAVVILAAVRAAHTQTRPLFSSMPDSRELFTELGRDVIRPSHLSAGPLFKKELPRVTVSATDTSQQLWLETDLWRLEVEKATWRLRLTDKKSGTRWELARTESHSAGIWWETSDNEATQSKTFPLTGVGQVRKDGDRWIVDGTIRGSAAAAKIEIAVLTRNIIRLSVAAPALGSKLQLGISLVGDGPFFGLGERFVKAQLDGLKTTLRTADDFGKDLEALKGGASADKQSGEIGHNWTYVPVPFLVTPHGMGLYLDTSWPSTFDLRRVGKSEVSVQVPASSMDLYLFVGDGPKDIVEAYTALTGRTPLPPPWAFGVWVNVTKGLHDLGAFYNEGVLNEAQRLRDLRIPASALWIQDLVDPAANIGWPLWTVGYYGPPREVAEDLHKLGFKVLVYTNPWVSSTLEPYPYPNPTYQQAEQEGNFVLGPDGKSISPFAFIGLTTAKVDFTKPGAADWWGRMKQESAAEYDFDGWMEDFGEQIRDTDRFANGKDGLELANLYPLLYHKISYESAHTAKASVVEFSRSGYAGSQGYTPVLWGGDQYPSWDPDDGLPSLISAGISAGLSGFSVWGPDIQSAGTSKELWIRWLEFGALCPIMRDHKWNQPKWAVDLWFDSETTDLFRRYAGLHVSLFPYLYAYAEEATNSGLPIMRHLMLEYPDDPMAWKAENEYLLGTKILVAPVISEGATTRSLYLPKGMWADYWTGEVLKGGREVEVSAPLDRIPIFLRAGSIIPLVDPDTQTLANDLAGEKYRTLDDRLTWRVIPASGTFQDDFTLSDGTKGSVDQQPSGIEVRGTGSQQLRSVEVILPTSGVPKNVLLSSHHLEALDDIGYRLHKRGWWLSPDQHTLHVLFSSADFTLEVVTQ
jgi:alpha-glucosidase (family GH31 glycosyl hydrolase)